MSLKIFLLVQALSKCRSAAVKDVYKSSGNFISDQLASHFSSAVTSPRRRTKRRREGGGGGSTRLESSRLAFGASSQGQFPPVESLFGSLYRSSPPPPPSECPYLSFFRESELYAGVASGARARARACGEIAEREGRFSRKAGAREREIAGAILRDPPERLPISPW